MSNPFQIGVENLDFRPTTLENSDEHCGLTRTCIKSEPWDYDILPSIKLNNPLN